MEKKNVAGHPLKSKMNAPIGVHTVLATEADGKKSEPSTL